MMEAHMAISFDQDPVGAILEYGHLHKTNDAQGRQGWEKANVKGVPGHSPWQGYCMHEYLLIESLGVGRNIQEVEPAVRRIMLRLRVLHLVEPYTQNGNWGTEWFEITPLGSNLVQTDSHREYIHGM